MALSMTGTSQGMACCWVVLQAGLALVGVSRVLAGDNNTDQNSVAELGSTAPGATANGASATYADSGADASTDPNKALLGMSLILASQVCGCIQAKEVIVGE
jgi:hypothetical protein